MWLPINGNWIGRHSGRAYWSHQTEVLFFGLYSEISGGKMPNKKSGATDYLTVAGEAGSETYQCPNTAAYIAADTDYIWFTITGTQRTVTTPELVNYDLPRTPVKYEDDNSNEIIAILILNPSVALSADKRNYLFRDFWLSPWWDDSFNDFGHIKSNRAASQNLNAFITTWNTENAGSATKTIIIPTSGAGYNILIDWGDGGSEESKTGTPGNITHVYATSGVKKIKIRGNFPRIYFNNAGDKLKLLTIERWGLSKWSSFNAAFYGCVNMVGQYTDYPDTSDVALFSNAFYHCDKFNSLLNIDTSSATNMSGMFMACGLYNKLLLFDTSKVTSMEWMFGYCPFNQVIAFNVPLVITMANMFTGGSLSTINYDALLILWSSQTVKPNVVFSAGATKYSVGAATTARSILTSAPNSWTITDGGQV